MTSTFSFRDLLPSFLAGAMLLLASLANFIDYNAYPYLRPEIGLIAFGALAIAALMASFYLGQRQWGRSFLEGLLVALFIDLNSTSLTIAVAGGFAVAAFAWWRRTSLLAPLAVVGGVILVTTVLGIRGPSTWIRVANADQAPPASHSSRPPILHMMLDEHLGIEGFNQLGGAGKEVGDELRRNYVADGFAVYGGAYSEHMRTVNSLPHIFNFGRKSDNTASKRGGKLGSTEYLKRLSQAGYRIKVLQSDYEDICTDNPVAECITYDSSSLGPTLIAPVTTGQRVTMIMSKFVQLSDIAAIATGSWNAASVRMGRLGLPFRQLNVKDAGRSSSIAAVVAFDDAIKSLTEARPGDVYLLHMLLPHYPYVVDRHCRPLPWEEWKLRHRTVTMKERHLGYFEQVRCTTQMVHRAVAAFESANPNRSIIIVHGDHGSRITDMEPVEENLGRFGDADMIAGYSTLFAVRAPQIKPGYDRRRQPINWLLHDLVETEFRSAPQIIPSRVDGVFIDDHRYWIPRRKIPLPKTWPATQ